MSHPKGAEGSQLPIASSEGTPSLPKGGERVVAAAIVHQQLEAHSGPLPTPKQLAEYEQYCPGAADRIIRMAEEEALHRRSMEHKLVTSQTDDLRAERSERRIGQFLGTFVCVSVLAAGVLIATLAQSPQSGAWIITTTLIGVAGIFVYTKQAEGKRQLAEKAEQRRALGPEAQSTTTRHHESRGMVTKRSPQVSERPEAGKTSLPPNT